MGMSAQAGVTGDRGYRGACIDGGQESLGSGDIGVSA